VGRGARGFRAYRRHRGPQLLADQAFPSPRIRLPRRSRASVGYLASVASFTYLPLQGSGRVAGPEVAATAAAIVGGSFREIRLSQAYRSARP
jgi:hypothetical protein